MDIQTKNGAKLNITGNLHYQITEVLKYSPMDTNENTSNRLTDFVREF